MDYIYKGMRFKINDNQIIWLGKGKKIKDIWSVNNLYNKDIKTEIIERMVSMHFLYKDYLVRL